MTISMNDSHLTKVESLGSFIKGSSEVSFKGRDRKEVYVWIEKTLKRFKYKNLGRKDKGTLKEYIQKVTGYSRAQVTRLVGQYLDNGCVRLPDKVKHRFPKRYGKEDIKLLAETDSLHNFPDGASLKAILKRMATVFGMVGFLNLSIISVSHVYNLRASREYRKINKDRTPTRPSAEVRIGEEKI